MSLGRASVAPAPVGPAPGIVPGLDLVEGRRWPRLPPLARLLGPAFVAAIAYVDPGNIVANMEAADRTGYELLWVVVAASAVAAFVQLQAASLGVATGRGLADLCAERLGPLGRMVMWLQCEAVAAATDVTEFVGAAVGIRLLFGLPLLPAGLVTAAVAFGLLGLQRRGASRFEAVVAVLLVVVGTCFVWEVIRSSPSTHAAVRGLTPSLAGPGAVLVAVGIVGATVMPHAVYLHSELAARQADGLDGTGRRRLLRRTRVDVAAALGVAGVINVAMLLVAARLLHPGLLHAALTFGAAHHLLAERLGGAAALVFSVGLLASGVSSCGVGTLAGQIVMGSFVRRRPPLWVRRAVTAVPALAILGSHVSLTGALLIAQAILSFGIPFAVIPLFALSADRRLMGPLASRPAVAAAGGLVAAGLVALNVLLLVRTL